MPPSQLPIPDSLRKTRSRKPATKMFQAQVSEKIYQACKLEWRKRGLTSRQVASWALQSFLITTNPAAAKRAGVKDGMASSGAHVSVGAAPQKQ